MKVFAVMVAALLGLIGVAACKDPGKAGPAQHKVYRITSGTVLGKTNYGLWKPTGEAPSCRWSVTKNGKVIAKGGRYDSVLSGSGAKGGVLSARNCGDFRK